MKKIEENIIALFKTYTDIYVGGDTYKDGENIILSTTSEEAEYLVKYDGEWYRVFFDWDEFCDRNFENADITPIEKDYPEEYLEEEYFSQGFDWDEYGEMNLI